MPAGQQVSTVHHAVIAMGAAGQKLLSSKVLAWHAMWLQSLFNCSPIFPVAGNRHVGRTCVFPDIRVVVELVCEQRPLLAQRPKLCSRLIIRAQTCPRRSRLRQQPQQPSHLQSVCHPGMSMLPPR